MQVIELDAPMFEPDELHKDIDFSVGGIRARWDAGVNDTLRMLEQAPWKQEPEPMAGISVHLPTMR
jgi:NTE family protein